MIKIFITILICVMLSGANDAGIRTILPASVNNIITKVNLPYRIGVRIGKVIIDEIKK